MHATGKGLAHYQQPLAMKDRQSWSSWPLLSVAADQGSVEESGKTLLRES